jgi:putative ABC transport system permease protein
VALSVVLLMGAGLMVRSLIAINQVETGFRTDGVLTLRVAIPERRYQTPASARQFFDNALQGLRALPGVQSVGGVDDLPTQNGSQQPIVLEGRPELTPRDQPTVEVRRITPGYFETLGIPLLRGRDAQASDKDVVLVSQAAVKLLWGDQDPIGHRITLPLLSRTMYKTVIGIVGDVKQGALTGPTDPTVYQYTNDNAWRSFTLALRSSAPPTTLMTAAPSVIRKIDPQQPVEDVRTLQAIVDDTLLQRRMNASLLGLFASVAVALAAVGIYSVLAYIVRGRRREIGIRTALGAQTQDVLLLFVIEGMKPACLGIAIGVVAALASATLIERLVFGVSASDPVTLAIVAAALAFVALVASFVPAWHASRLSPLTVLRDS